MYRYAFANAGNRYIISALFENKQLKMKYTFCLLNAQGTGSLNLQQLPI